MPGDDTAPRVLRFGEALAHLCANSKRNPRFALGSMAGRFVLLCVTPDASSETARAAFAAIARVRFPEDERLCAVFNLDEAAAPDAFSALGQTLVFNDAAIGHAVRLHDAKGAPEGRWLLLDPTLRVLAQWRLSEHDAALAAHARSPHPDLHAGAPLHAPVLIAPRVFEPDFCAELIAY